MKFCEYFWSFPCLALYFRRRTNLHCDNNNEKHNNNRSNNPAENCQQGIGGIRPKQNIQHLLFPLSLHFTNLVSESKSIEFELFPSLSVFPSWAALVIGPFKSETFQRNCRIYPMLRKAEKVATNIFRSQQRLSKEELCTKIWQFSSASMVILGRTTASERPFKLKEDMEAW